MKINNWVFVPFGVLFGTPIAVRIVFLLSGLPWSEDAGGISVGLSIVAAILAALISSFVAADGTNIGHTDLRKLWGWWK